MVAEQISPEPLYHCEPFTATNGYLHSWTWHDIENPSPDPARRALKHDHLHTSRTCDHTHAEPDKARA
jgi:hypothetical protein